MKKHTTFLSVASLALATVTFALPIETVPWNDHVGAATFSFDDGLNSQVQNLTFLDNMPDVSVTFFVCTNTMDFASNPNGHLGYAKKGHEIGNHTMNHKDMTTISNANEEVSGAAKKLRESYGLEATSLATPYCAQNATVKNAINQEHFINRGCGGSGLMSWATEPDWMQVDSHYWMGGSSTVSQFKGSLDQAASGKWHVMLNHGVEKDWDIISANDIKTLIEYAVQKKLWVASFSTVGAYYRAHFTIDKATSTPIANGYKVSWASPHAHMPKSVPLRVKIDKSSVGADAVVMQNGKVIAENSDGTYNIEFMDLSLEVVKKSASSDISSSSSSIANSSSSESGNVPFKAMTIPGKIEMENYDKGGQGIAFNDIDGKNDATLYREDDAGIVKTADGYAIGYTMMNEWFEYTINADCEGQYLATAYAATGASESTLITLSVGDAAVTVAVPNTAGDWSSYNEVFINTFSFKKGKNTFRLTFNSDYTNVDWIKFEPMEACEDNNVIPVAQKFVAGSFSCQVFDVNGHLLKSITANANSLQGLWNSVNANLNKGVYILRYGDARGMHSVRVQK